MATMTETRPEVKAQEVRCEGTRKDGDRCNYRLAVAVHPFAGWVELKCPKCHTDRLLGVKSRHDDIRSED